MYGATQRINRYDAISGLQTNANNVKTAIDNKYSINILHPTDRAQKQQILV